MNFRSIHFRLILWYTALVIFLSLGFGAYTYYSLDHRLYQEMQDTLARRVEQVRENIVPHIASVAPDVIAREIDEVYSPEESSRFIRITHPDGTIVYISGAPKDGAFDPALVPVDVIFPERGASYIEQAGSGWKLLIVGRKTTVQGHDYIIEMGAPTEPVDGTLRKLIITLLIGLPAVVVIAIIGGSILIRRALLPVETIRSTAEKITFSNLRQRLPVAATGDALEHLSVTLNQMLERLEQAYQQASRFSADASHELRTPLTIMRGELESVEATMRTWQLPVEFRERIGSVLEEVERLSGIVESLFALARLDAGEAKIEHTAFDLAKLVTVTVEQMQLLAEEKNLSVTIDAPQPVFVMGDAARLKQVIVNLLDNAIKYTPAGGAIRLAAHATTTKAVLSIQDNGIGVSLDALPHIFERFYRADKVRSRATQGAGLGLSIVHAICQAHGGTIGIQSAEGTGTTLTVELPLADPAPGENLDAAA